MTAYLSIEHPTFLGTHILSPVVMLPIPGASTHTAACKAQKLLGPHSTGVATDVLCKAASCRNVCAQKDAHSIPLSRARISLILRAERAAGKPLCVSLYNVAICSFHLAHLACGHAQRGRGLIYRLLLDCGSASERGGGQVLANALRTLLEIRGVLRT